jgi:hypothetical protein
MYTIEERSYGVKITFDRIPTSDEFVSLADSLKQQLRTRVRNKQERIVSLIVSRNTDKSTFAVALPMIYVFDA